MKKILLFNQGNTPNYGDVAINQVITKFFEKKYEIEFHPYWDEKRIFGSIFFNKGLIYRIIMKYSFLRDFFYKRYLKKEIKGKYDAVIVGGGELLSGHRGFNTALLCISHFFKKKCDMFIIGVSGNGNLPNKIKNRYIDGLREFKRIFVRDNYTKRVINDEYELNCEVYPDVVFSYKLVNNIIINKQINHNVIFSPIYYYDEIGEYLNIKDESEFVDFLIECIIKNTEKRDCLIIAPTVIDDEKICNTLYRMLKEKKYFNNIKLYPYKDLDFYIELLKKSQKVISCRMHGLILAKLFECEIEPIVFKNKLYIFKKEYKNNNRDISLIEKESFDSLNKIMK